MKRIYLDYAATTPLDSRVAKVMEPYFTKNFGNPSALYAEGVAAKKEIQSARTMVACVLEAHPDEIVFTSGGTEANNLAIFGVVAALRKTHFTEVLARPTRLDGGQGGRGSLRSTRHSENAFCSVPHIVTTNIEHASILEPLKNFDVSYVPVEPNGIVKAEKILAAIRPNTVLVSVMYANNEIGTIQPIAKIGKAIRKLRSEAHQKILFHTDACQAPLYLDCLVNALGIDLLSLDGHKIYGPKGVGALYVRRGTMLAPQLLGGGQERRLRSTTENIPAIVGFAEALKIATIEREKESLRLTALRDHLYTSILQNTAIRKVVINGSMEARERLPNNLNISLPGVDTEMLVLKLDAVGIACSTKSSCLKDEKRSYVVAALGGDEKRAESSLRFTLGRATTKKQLTRVATIFAAIV